MGTTKEETTQNCYVCGNEFQGVEPDRCCSGFMCGCMGMPTDPSQIVCSEKCYDKLMNPKDCEYTLDELEGIYLKDLELPINYSEFFNWVTKNYSGTFKPIN